MKKNVLIIIFVLIFTVFQFPESKVKSEKLLSTLIKAAQSIEKFNALKKHPGNYPVAKRRIIRLLRRAASFTDSNDQKDYLLSLIPDLRQSGKFNCTLFPGDLKDSNIFLFKKKGEKECFPVVLLLRKDITQEIRKFSDMTRTLVKKGLLKRKVKFFPEKLFISAAETIYPDSLKKNIILYHYKSEKTEQYPIIFFMVKNIEKSFNEKIVPAIRKVILRKEINDVDFNSYIIALAIHKLSHFMAPVVVKAVKSGADRKKDILTTPRDLLKEYFYSAEEVRAEFDMMNIIFLLEKNALIDEKTADKVVKTSILSKISNLKNDRRRKSNLNSVVILNAIFKSGGLDVNLINKKLKFSVKLLKTNLEKLNKLFYDFEKSGKYEECAAYFKENSEMSKQLKAILKLI